MKKLGKRIAILTFLGATGIFYSCGGKGTNAQMFDTEETKVTEQKSTEQPRTDTKEKQTKSSKEQIYVYICGQVKHPGVYGLTPGARVNDVVTKAGGMSKEADASRVNLAKTVADEEQIYVPSKKEAGSHGLESAADNSGQTTKKADKSSGRVNINTASKDELMSLPGIGESKADRILAYRETNGRFSSIDDLTKIDGIKNGVLNKIKDKITV